MTEEHCAPLIEKYSNLKIKRFFCGYSPERINPGDKKNKITNIIKLLLDVIENFKKVDDSILRLLKQGHISK